MAAENTGFEQPNYTQTPNALFDKYLSEIDSMTELKVVLAIVRKTLGWHKTYDIISLTQLEKLTGLSRQGVIDGIEKAVTRGLVERKSSGQSFIYMLKVNGTGEEATSPTSQNFRPVSQEAKTTSQNFRPEVVNDLDQQLVNDLDTQKKGLNKSKETSSMTRPPKSEAVLIEEYFLKATTGSIGFMAPIQRTFIKDLIEQGFTLERCKPGIDYIIAEMNGKGKTVSSFKLCIPSIIQLDPSRVKPISIQQAPSKTQAELDKEAEIADWHLRQDRRRQEREAARIAV